MRTVFLFLLMHCVFVIDMSGRVHDSLFKSVEITPSFHTEKEDYKCIFSEVKYDFTDYGLYIYSDLSQIFSNSQGYSFLNKPTYSYGLNSLYDALFFFNGLLYGIKINAMYSPSILFPDKLYIKNDKRLILYELCLFSWIGTEGYAYLIIRNEDDIIKYAIFDSENHLSDKEIIKKVKLSKYFVAHKLKK